MKKVCAVILAGGEGSRLGVLTAKRTKPVMQAHRRPWMPPALWPVA